MIRHHTRVVVINWFEDDLKTHTPNDEFFKAWAEPSPMASQAATTMTRPNSCP